MKRSEINKVIREMEALIDKVGFALPPFCKWTPEEWETKGHEYDEIRDNMLGWDNTDNRFYEPVGRFPEIEEDEPPYRLLCNEYPAAKE